MKDFKDNDKISIKSLVNAQVSIIDKELRLSRTWEKRNAKKVIDFGVLKEAIYNPGTQYMFEQGILQIEDPEARVALGLETEEILTNPEAAQIKILDETQKDRYLTKLPLGEFKMKLEELPREQVNELAQWAIEKEQIDFSKADLIKQRIGIDIPKAIELKRADKAE